jgi:hypothetical protein
VLRIAGKILFLTFVVALHSVSRCSTVSGDEYKLKSMHFLVFKTENEQPMFLVCFFGLSKGFLESETTIKTMVSLVGLIKGRHCPGKFTILLYLC